jgi:vanillate/3-O-methylgallate O-demethylase
MEDNSELFAFHGTDNGVLNDPSGKANPATRGASLLFQMAPGLSLPYQYGGVPYESAAYRESAWIGTTLNTVTIYDVYGPDAAKFLTSISVNDFSNLGFTTIRHMIIPNEKGQILNDGVVMRIGEDRYRAYCVNPPLQYYVETSDMDVNGEDMTGQEYFIQIDGIKSLEILEDAFHQDLHFLKFAHRADLDVDGHSVRILRLGMTGYLAYEIHGLMSEYAYMYERVWESGQKFGARKLGQYAYNLFTHTEGGFPNIYLHYPMPWFESDPGLKAYLEERPTLGALNTGRTLTGSSTNLEDRFVTPYDVGWGFLVNYNHDFPGKAALEAIRDNPPRQLVTLQWNPEDLGRVFAAMNDPDGEPAEDISEIRDLSEPKNSFFGNTTYRADEVFDTDGNKIGISVGRIHSFNYHATISLGFIKPMFAAEGTEVSVLWGTPGTRQMTVRATVAHTPYNDGPYRNNHFDVEQIPHRFQ